MNDNVYQIAIDGPSGSGKSTLAKGAAEKLGIMYLDTGAMYRTCALCAIKSGIDPKDEEAVKDMLGSMDLKIKFEDGIQHMLLNGEDVTGSIRTPEVSMAASAISALPVIRTAMVDMQRKIAADQSFVVDGRDIGSVVLPDARYKFFLTASSEARAKRRCLELEQKGTPQAYEDVLKDIIQRDKQDSERAASPLVKVDDAILIDTSDIGIEETLELLLSYIKE
ncbi:MAG: (d)CMP kinase [Clostridiales bacterium]|nr:(d)CMP kinase [Clostridiales bacterium]